MAAGDIKPAEGMIAVMLFDEYDDDDESPPSSRPADVQREYEKDPDRVIMGVCMGVGAGVKSCKAGETVCLKPWARYGFEVGGGVRLTEASNVVGVVSPR
jgi:hypothetical protein